MGIALTTCTYAYYACYMTFEAVLFDLDYTLFDSEASEREALSKTLLENQISPTDSTIAQYKVINLSLWKMLEREEIDLEKLRVKRFQSLLEQLHEIKDPQKLADSYTLNLGKCGKFYPEVQHLLESLMGVFKLGLVTNGVSETQRLRLEIHDYAKYFDAIVVSGEFGIPKPNPAIFKEALSLLGLNSSDSVIMVGDSLSSDVKGARISGLTSCWFNPASAVNTSTENVDYVIQSLDQLFEILDVPNLKNL